MSVVFVAAYNLQVLVPLLAARVLGGSSELYGIVVSSLGRGAVSCFLTNCLVGETGSDDGRRMVRITEHRLYLADFAVWGLFRACWHVFAGCFLRFSQRYGHQHPTTQGS